MYMLFEIFTFTLNHVRAGMNLSDVEFRSMTNSLSLTPCLKLSDSTLTNGFTVMASLSPAALTAAFSPVMLGKLARSKERSPM